jgi:hypothetical protein
LGATPDFDGQKLENFIEKIPENYKDIWFSN